MEFYLQIIYYFIIKNKYFNFIYFVNYFVDYFIFFVFFLNHINFKLLFIMLIYTFYLI